MADRAKDRLRIQPRRHMKGWNFRITPLFWGARHDGIINPAEEQERSRGLSCWSSRSNQWRRHDFADALSDMRKHPGEFAVACPSP
jgi:hypothetical protein